MSPSVNNDNYKISIDVNAEIEELQQGQDFYNDDVQPGSTKVSMYVNDNDENKRIMRSNVMSMSNSFRSDLSDVSVGLQIMENGLVNQIDQDIKTPKGQSNHKPQVNNDAIGESNQPSDIVQNKRNFVTRKESGIVV